MRKYIITLFLILQVVILLSCSKNINSKHVVHDLKSNKNSQEIVNVIENKGKPIKLVIEVIGVDSQYVNLKKATEVNKNDIDLFITFKNIDILSYEDAHKFNKTQIVVSTNKHNWHLYGMNQVPLPNTVHYGIFIDNLSNRVCNVTINKVFNKYKKQILMRPITFKLKISNKIKSLN
jgi:hypothetical protein